MTAVVIRFVDITLGWTPQGGALSIVLRVMFLKVCIGTWDSTQPLSLSGRTEKQDQSLTRQLPLVLFHYIAKEEF